MSKFSSISFFNGKGLITSLQDSNSNSAYGDLTVKSIDNSLTITISNDDNSLNIGFNGVVVGQGLSGKGIASNSLNLDLSKYITTGDISLQANSFNFTLDPRSNKFQINGHNLNEIGGLVQLEQSTSTATLPSIDGSNLLNVAKLYVDENLTVKKPTSLYVDSNNRRVWVTNKNNTEITISVNITEEFDLSNSDAVPTINAVKSYVDKVVDSLQNGGVTSVNGLQGAIQIQGDQSTIEVSNNGNVITIGAIGGQQSEQHIFAVDEFPSSNITNNSIYVNKNTKQAKIVDQNGDYYSMSMQATNDLQQVSDNQTLATSAAVVNYINNKFVTPAIQLVKPAYEQGLHLQIVSGKMTDGSDQQTIIDTYLYENHRSLVIGNAGGIGWEVCPVSGFGSMYDQQTIYVNVTDILDQKSFNFLRYRWKTTDGITTDWFSMVYPSINQPTFINKNNIQVIFSQSQPINPTVGTIWVQE